MRRQTGFYVFAAAAPLSFLGYQLTRPGANGESTVTNWLRNFDYFNDYEERNALRSNYIDQASHDKHLFLYAGKNPHVELKMPEYVSSALIFIYVPKDCCIFEDKRWQPILRDQIDIRIYKHRNR